MVAAVIEDEHGRVLLCRRPPGTHMAGLWEFPGGKREEGEDLGQALVRELHEELGISVEVGDPITFAVHRELELEILLLFYAAKIVNGRPVPLEGQEVLWVDPRDLGRYTTPPADLRIVEILQHRGHTKATLDGYNPVP